MKFNGKKNDNKNDKSSIKIPQSNSNIATLPKQ